MSNGLQLSPPCGVPHSDTAAKIWHDANLSLLWRIIAGSRTLCTSVDPISCLSDAWRVLACFTTPQAIVEGRLWDDFFKNSSGLQFEPGDCKWNASRTRSATEVKLLNCDPASLNRFRSLIAHWLQMRALRVKPQKLVNKPTPQKDTLDNSSCPSITDYIAEALWGRRRLPKPKLRHSASSFWSKIAPETPRHVRHEPKIMSPSLWRDLIPPQSLQ